MSATSVSSQARPNIVQAFKRAIGGFLAHGGPDLAASLTYFAVLSLFPALLAMTSLLGLMGEDVIQNLMQIARDMGAPESALTIVSEFIAQNLGGGGASVALVVGVLGALFSASNYVNAFSRAMNRVYEVSEGRPIWKLRPWVYLITVLMTIGVLLVAFALVVGGGFAESIAGVVGLGSTAALVWAIAKWPAVVLIVMAIVAVLYWGTPNVKPRFRLISVGSAFAIIVWALATVGIGVYVSSPLASYNATYGALAGVIILLLWLWVTNIVLVLGAEVDKELERSRQLRSGLPAEESLQLPMRDASGVAKKEAKEAEQVAERRRVRMEAQAEPGQE